MNIKCKKKIYIFVFFLFTILLSICGSYLISKNNDFTTDFKLIFYGQTQTITSEFLNFIFDDKQKKYIKINAEEYIGNISIYFNSNIDKEYELTIYDINRDGVIQYAATSKISQNHFFLNLKIDKKFSNFVFNINNPEIYKKIDHIIINESVFNKYFFIRFLIIFIFVSFILMHFIFDIGSMYEKIYKYKYIIGFLIIVFAVVFELNGSSISLWNITMPYNDKADGLIMGKARLVRTDEWCVYTPIQISQALSGNKYFNNILRGTKTDMFLFYAQPVKNVISIFRPFLCGFLILDPSKGLSFYWTARIVSLFLVSLMFFMLVTGDKKMLSATGAVMVTFAPAVQWWITPNGITEMLIFGQLAILMLYQYMNNNNFFKRFLFLFIIFICCGGYALAIYPAWQIPLGYVFAAAALWVIFENKHKCKISFYDAVFALFFAGLLIACFLYIYNKSSDTIYSLMNTTYPGKRFENGGGQFFGLFQSWGNIFFVFKDFIANSNVCEKSAFIDLFPIGLILSLWIIFKEKVNDRFLIVMTICSVLLGFWCVIGVPNLLANISLMSMSQAHRTLVIFGFVNILVLIRSLSLLKIGIKYNKIIFISIVFAIIVFLSSVLIYADYLNTVMTFIIIVLSFLMMFLGLQLKFRRIFMVMIMCVVAVSGFFVNPIQSGIDIISKTELAKTIKKINFDKPGLWMTEGTEFNIPNYIVMQGIPAVNSTNIYPNIELWQKLDKDHKYSNIYNRYSHVLISLRDRLYHDKFELVQFDVIKINLIPEDIAMLNISYIITKNNLSEYDREDIKFSEIYSDANFKIFKIERNLKLQ